MEKIAVLMGGVSSEHEVSLDSGINVLIHLDRKKYEIIPVIIAKNNGWSILPTYNKDIPGPIYKKFIQDNVFDVGPVSGITALDLLKRNGIKTIFLALHGKFGEDGRIQALLEIFGFYYNGSGVAASALAMDKIKSMMIFRSADIKVPKYLVVNQDNQLDQIIKLINDNFGFPCVIKPADSGSSIGLSIADQEADLELALKKALIESDYIIIQDFITGIEISCGVLEINGKLQSLPPTEIIPKNKLFSYQDKYEQGMATEITPARLATSQLKQIRNLALQTHQLLGCSGISRTDMIVSNNDIFVLELNTLPGLTRTSLIPKQAQTIGIGFPSLLETVIQSASPKLDRNNLLC